MSNNNEEQTKPFLYNQIEALHTQHHAHLRLNVGDGRHFAFAKETNSIMLTLPEFVPACGHYLIVFTTKNEIIPSAIVGIRNNENLFVNEAGAWKVATYIPAYIRRYPFVLAQPQGTEANDAVLCIDPTFSGFSEKEGEPLVVDGQSTQLTKNAIDFCLSYANEGRETEAFCKALKDNDLLINKQMIITGEVAKKLGGNERYILGDFAIIDEQKLRSLPDDLILEWVKRGWMQAAYAQIISLSHWDKLIALVE